MFGLGEELEDEQLMSAAEAGEAPEFVATIDRDVWTLVMRAEKRAAILRAAESGGAEAVLILCDELRGLPRVPF